jgi:hypothetical protein
MSENSGSDTKPARQWAKEIWPLREDRRRANAMLAQVPENLRPITITILRIFREWEAHETRNHDVGGSQ